MPTPRSRQKTGRYRGVGSPAVANTGHLLPVAIYHPSVEIAHAAVPDPNPALRGKRQRAQINVRTDPLEIEYHAKRIDEGAYHCGRLYQMILESCRGYLTSGSAGFNSIGGSQAPFTSSDASMAAKMTAADRVTDLLTETLPVLGMRGQQVMEMVLLRGLPFNLVADAFAIIPHGKYVPGFADRHHRRKHSSSFYAEFFRNCLRDLASHWSEHGHPRASG